jgi:thiol-disulfide isomerase/thioredoxin
LPILAGKDTAGGSRATRENGFLQFNGRCGYRMATFNKAEEFMRRLICAVVAMIGLGQVALAEKAPDFPPGLFNDGRAYSLKDLEGKAVVLFFYEQDCPKCRGTIPERNEVVYKYKDKPVKFIAIAAGDSMTEAKGYLMSTKLAMPVFADPLSLMEQRYKMKISLNNIYQFRVIGPTGEIEGFSMDPEVIDKAVSKVQWKYKDAGYDPKLAGAIEAFEWGQYAIGMQALKPYLKNSKKEVAESAKRLHEAVTAEGERWLADAEKANGSENPVGAYDLFVKISTAFAGEPLAKKAADPLRKLAATPAVKDELAARAMYANLCQGAAKAQPNQRPAVADFAASVAKKYPKTPTGEKCAEIAKELSTMAAAK